MIPLQINFHQMESSEAIEKKIQDRVQKLEKFFEHITDCRVIVEVPHKHHQKGKLFAIKIIINVPGKEIVSSRSPDQHHAHEDINISIRDAFDAVKRQLEDYVRTRRGEVKRHEDRDFGKRHEERDLGLTF
ncbi:MAG: HPF/RaiA family ribosome-associated protein [Planctomycetota bacterium]